MGNKHSRPSVASTSAETTPEKRSSLGSFLKRKSNGGRRRSSAVRLLGKLAFLSNHSSSSNAKKKKTENKKTENKKLRVTPPPTPTLPEVHPEEILLTVSKQQQDVSSEISMLPSKEELSVPFPFQPQETPTPIPNTLRHSVAGTTKLENNDTKNSAKPSRRNTVAVSSQNKKNKSTGGPNKTTKPNLTEASETTSDATKLASENPDPQTTTQEKQRRNTVVVASSRNNGAASPPPKSSSSTTKRRRGTVATTTTTVKRSEAASPPLKQTKRGSTPVAFQQPQPQPQHIIIPISDTQETPSSKNEQQPFQQTSVLPMTRSSTPTESPQPPPKKRSSTPVSRPTTPKPTKRSSTPVNNNGTNSPKPNKRSSSTPRPSSPKPTTTSKRSSTPVSRPTTPKPTKRSSTPVNNGRKSPKPNKRSSTPVNTGRKSSPKPNKRSSTPVSRPTSPEANKRSSTPTPAGARGSSSPKPNNTQSSIAPPMPTSSTRVPTMPAMQDLSSAVPSVTPAPTVPKQSEQTNAVVLLLPANNNNRATTTELQSSKQQSPTQDAEQPIPTNASTTQPPAVVGSSNNNSQKATIIVTRATNNVRRCSTPVLTTTTTTTTGIATTTLNSNKDNNNLTVPWWHSSKGDDSNNNNPAVQKSTRCSTPVLLEGEAAGTTVTPKSAEVVNNSSSVKQARRTATPILSSNSSSALLVALEQSSTPGRSEDSPTVCSTSTLIIDGEETPSMIMKTERPETPAFPALNVHPTTTQENKQQAKRGSSWNPPFLQSALFTSGTTSTPYPEQAPTESSATTTRKSILPSNRTARHSSILPMVEEEDPSGKEMCPPRRRSRTSLSGRPNPRRSSVFQVNQNGGLSLLFDGEDISDESETDLSFHSRRNSRNSLSGSRRRSNNRSISSLLGGEDLSGSETELLQQPRKKSILSGRPNPRRSSVFRVNASGGIAPMTPGDDMPESETTPKKCQSSTASLFGFSKPRRSVFQMGPTGGITPLIDMSMSESEFEEEVSLAVQPSPLSPLLEDGDEEEELSTVGLKPCPARPRRSNMFLRMMPRRQPLISSEDDDFSEACNSEAKKAEATSPPTAPSRRTSLFAGILSRHQTPTDDEAPIIAENVSKAERRRSSGSAVGLTSSVFSLLTFPSLARRNSTNYTPMDVKKALKIAPKSKWKLEKVRFSGQFDCNKMGKWEEVRGKRIDKGIKKFTANPDKYVAITFQNSMRFAHSTKNNVYTLIHREGTTPINPLDTASDGRMSLMINKYQHLRSMPNDTLPLANRDAFSWDLTFDGQLLHDRDNPPILPGRGMGVGDTPNLKIIGDIDPADIVQGEVGNCWLLSAISALAEFDGAIKKLFRKTKNLDSMPGDGPNMYTISLFDLTTWKEVDIVIDESLCGHPFRHGELLGAQITEDGELWVSYLEKAFMVHCGGGWDDLEGGHCTHAWSMMTGCKEQYFIRKNYHTGKYHCSAKYDMFTKQWKQLQNQPRHKDMAGLEPIAWPKVGGGGAMGLEISQDELFMQMFAWDQVDYIVGASSKGTSEEEIASGMVRNHCYSVIDAHHNVAATGIDLFKVRNPWGHGEIEDGQFGDTGSGWEDYPQIKALLKPVVADDGIFYMTKAEFFVFFDHIYLSACSMTQFKED